MSTGFNSPTARSAFMAKRIARPFRMGLSKQKPPFVAVRAFLRSCGYMLCPTAGRQKAKWEVGHRDSWVALVVLRANSTDSTPLVRWVRWIGGEQPQISDGRDVPRESVLAYAIAKARGEAAR